MLDLPLDIHPRPTCYYADAYSKPDQAVNVHDAIIACDRLMELGFAPYCPHLTHLWHLVSAKPYEVWMELDATWVMQCDYTLRGVLPSSGADWEVRLRVHHGKSVFFDEHSLVKQAKADGWVLRPFGLLTPGSGGISGADVEEHLRTTGAREPACDGGGGA